MGQIGGVNNMSNTFGLDANRRARAEAEAAAGAPAPPAAPNAALNPAVLAALAGPAAAASPQDRFHVVGAPESTGDASAVDPHAPLPPELLQALAQSPADGSFSPEALQAMLRASGGTAVARASQAAPQMMMAPVQAGAQAAVAPQLAPQTSPSVAPQMLQLMQQAAMLGVTPQQLMTLAVQSQAQALPPGPAAQAPMSAAAPGTAAPAGPADAAAPAGAQAPVSKDPKQAAKAQALQTAQRKAKAVMDSYPQDDKLLTVTPGKDDLVKTWNTAAEKLLGPGDKKGLTSFLKDNAGGFQELAGLLEGKRDTDATKLSGKDFISAALGALKAQHPDATFELVAMKKGAKLPEGADNVIIKMTTEGKGKDGKPADQTDLYSVRKDALMGKDAAPVVRATILKSPGLTRAFEASFAKVTGSSGQSAAAIFQAYPDFAQGAVAAAVLSMPADAQLRLLTTLPQEADKQVADKKLFGHALTHKTESNKDTLFGGLLKKVDPDSSDAIVRADGTSVVTGKPAPSKTLVSIAGAEAKTEKNYRILNAHSQVLLAPVFEEAIGKRGDSYHALAGSDIENEVGAAMQIPPNNPDHNAEVHYTGETLKALAPVVEQLRKFSVGGKPINVATVPVVANTPEGTMQVPVFRVQTAEGERFVDTQGRRYDNWNDFLDHNQLPIGKMAYPVDGHLKRGHDGQVAFKTKNTPMVVDTFKEQAEAVGDKVALGGGFAIGAVAIVESGGAALPIVGAVLGSYGAVRSGQMVADIATHGESLDPIKSENARMQELNLAASTLGLGSIAGFTLGVKLLEAAGGARAADNAISAMAGTRAGAQIDAMTAGALMGAKQTGLESLKLSYPLAATLVASQAVDVANTANQTSYLIQHWNQLSWTDRAMLGSQMALFTPMQYRQAKQLGEGSALRGATKIYSASSYRQQFAQLLLGRQVMNRMDDVNLATFNQTTGGHLKAGLKPPPDLGYGEKDVTEPAPSKGTDPAPAG